MSMKTNHQLPLPEVLKQEYPLSKELQKLRGEFGAELADTYEQNARDIINGDQVDLDWQPLPKKKRFWFF